MIEGIKIELASAELREHLGGRAEHHRKKAESYEGQVVGLKEVADGDEVRFHSANVVDTLQNKVREHRSKAALFSFLAEHLIPDETYRLSENDLTRIEIVSRYF